MEQTQYMSNAPPNMPRCPPIHEQLQVGSAGTPIDNIAHIDHTRAQFLSFRIENQGV